MLCPSEIATIVNAFSVAIAQGKTVEELNILSAIFTQIGDTLATIAIQTSNLENCNNKNYNIK